MSIINVENVSCKSGKRYLLHNVNWKVDEGDHWLIFGMNGSGKTTLLSMLAGFLSPSAGKVELLGKTYNKNTVFDLRRQIGWVSSSFFDKHFHNEQALQIILSGCTGTLNVDENITDADVRRAKALLKELRLADKINMPFSSMSKGERQNILIARALINRPRILILDEPGTGLDVYAREHMKNTIKDLAEHTHMTILYVTHYPEEVQSFMNKTLLLRNGCIFAQGNTDEVFTEKNISRLLGETASIHKDVDGSIKLHLEVKSELGQFLI